MRQVSPPIHATTGQARALAAAGDLTAARDLLDAALHTALTPPAPAHPTHAPPTTAPTTAPTAGAPDAGAPDAGPRRTERLHIDPERTPPEVADAAALHAGILMTLGDPRAARPWADLAHRARLHLYGPTDPRTVTAEATLAAVLHRTGAHREAAARYADVVQRLTALDGPDSARVLAAEADLATAEHSGGDCPTAVARLGDVVHRHRTVFGDGSPAGIKMLARLGAMARDCGDTATGDRHLATAADLCRRHLPADHPLTRQIADLGTASPDPDHPDHHADPPPATAPSPTDHATPPGPRTAEAAPTTGPGTTTHPDGPPPADAATRAGTESPGAVAGAAGARIHPGPGPDAVPLDDIEGETAAEAAAPRTRAEAVGSPGRGDARLPVLRWRPEASRRWMATTAVLVALAAVAVLAVVAVGAYRLLSPAPTAAPTAAPPAGPTAAPPAGPAPTTAPAAPAAPATAVPDGAPTAVGLRDGRDSVALTWTYPAGSEGPVIVSGGRSGQPTKAFQQLPAGSESYVVYGLNQQLDYCFSVAVAWSVDRVPASAPVCTTRTVPGR
jgi:hypothetical protein